MKRRPRGVATRRRGGKQQVGIFFYVINVEFFWYILITYANLMSALF